MGPRRAGRLPALPRVADLALPPGAHHPAHGQPGLRLRQRRRQAVRAARLRDGGAGRLDPPAGSRDGAVPGRGGPALPEPRRRRPQGHRPRHPRERPLRPRGRGRLDHHPAAGQDRLPRGGADAAAQAAGSHPRGLARGPPVQGRDPVALPEHGLFRRRRLRPARRGAALFRQAPRTARRARVRHAGGPVEGADALRPDQASQGRARTLSHRAHDDGRRRGDHPRGRRAHGAQPAEGAHRQGAPAAVGALVRRLDHAAGERGGPPRLRRDPGAHHPRLEAAAARRAGGAPCARPRGPQPWRAPGGAGGHAHRRPRRRHGRRARLQGQRVQSRHPGAPTARLGLQGLRLGHGPAPRPEPVPADRRHADPNRQMAAAELRGPLRGTRDADAGAGQVQQRRLGA